jgi:hypothetical protein
MRRSVTFNWHDARTTLLEGVLARGDRTAGRRHRTRWKNGCRLDGWSECFSLENGSPPSGNAGSIRRFTPTAKDRGTKMLPWDI